MREKFFILFSVLGLFIQTNLNSQEIYETLKSTFRNYKVISLPSSSIKAELNNQRSDEKQITLNGWEMTLFDSKIIGKNYKLSTSIPSTEKREMALAMNGYTRQGGRVSLTFNDNYIFGFITVGNNLLYIEPLYHFEKGARTDQYVIYNSLDIIEEKTHTCGMGAEQKMHKEHENHKHGQNSENKNRSVGLCYEVEYAIASDWLMFQQYGSITAVENHAIGVTNNVQNNYDDEFVDELKFEIVEQFVSNCSTCDPWTSSTNASTLLNSFTNWAPNGFGNAHDLGSIWTGRDFDGSTIGIAWLGVICTNLNYNALEDFSSNANLKRVMVAHEIGHNFDADHDASGSPYIMAPSVSNTSQWSTASKSSIQNHYNGANCLGSCASSNAPTANFTYAIQQECTPGLVQYTNTSTGTITNYNWEFEGGIPATSTLQNPIVTYNDPGIYDVKLTVVNGNQNNTLELNDEINIIATPVANFDFIVVNSTVFFNNLSNGGSGTNYVWNFGDNSTSTDFSPTHTYANDGTYTVTLDMENDCGTSVFTSDVVIATAPIAGFTSNATSGCGTFTINFTNTSTANATNFNWVFQGGTPATSTLPNPIITYSNPGAFQVSLTASNAQGSDNKTFNNYITALASPIANFSFNQSGQVFNFTSTSSNATTYAWNFGDGTTSNLQNPSHTYAVAGTYNVTHTADNANCPENSITKVVTATSAPISSFTTANGNTGCAPFSTTFTSTSQNSPSTFLWTFVGGNPSTSTSPSPLVSYQNVGSYDVTLITTNAFGSDTLTLANYIQVNGVPTSNFSFTKSGLTYTFASNANNAQNLLWNFGDGNTSTNINPTHTFASQGNYVVTLESSNTCGTYNEAESVAAYLLPQANAFANGNIICANQAIIYTDASTGAITDRVWTFTGGSPSTATSPTVEVTYSASGSYPVKLVVSNAAGSDTLDFIQNINLLSTPNALFTEQYTNTLVVCTNGSSTSNDIEWLGPSGAGNGNQYSFTPPTNGNYTVTMIAKNACGSDTLSKTIAYNGYAVASVNSGANGNPICASSTVQYNATPIWNATYQWTFPGGNPSTSTVENPIIEYNTTGIYNVTLIVSNPNGSDTLELLNYVTVIGKPEANYSEIINQGNVSFTYAGQGAVGYLWNFAGLGTSVERNPNFVFTTSGTYPVSCIVNNICGQDTLVKNINIIISSIEEEALRNNISIYPNPTSDNLNIELSNLVIDDNYTLTLSDDMGKKIQSISIKSKNEILDLSELPSGIYILTVNSGTGRITYKVSKI